jgi:type IV pilus assembly protein PilC
MPQYRYRAIDSGGVAVKGVSESRNERDLRDELLAKNLDVTEIRERKSLNVQLAPQRVPVTEVMHFSRQMATFVRAGMPITEGLDVVAESSSNKRWREILRQISEAIVNGIPFSDALAEHASVLPPYYIGLCRAAELTGRLDTVLEQLADYIERDLEARSKIKAALLYPGIVLAMSFVTVGVLTTVVLPRFEKFFKDFKTPLPAPTRALLVISHAAGTYWYLFPVLGIAIVATLVSMQKTKRGRSIRDHLMLRIPVISRVATYAVIERLCRVLGSMTRAGVSLPEAMQAAAESSNNVVFEAELKAAQERMLAGEGIAEPIATSGRFPRPVVQMIRVGEATGTLDHQLETAANYYQIELEYKLKRVTTLIEPAVIIGMGLIVGFVAIALVSAMYGIYKSPSLGVG